MNQYGEVDSNDLTGPISKTYNSGQNIEIVFSVHLNEILNFKYKIDLILNLEY